MWEPDPEFVELRQRLAFISQRLVRVHEQLVNNPTAISNRAEAICFLRNFESALGGLAIDSKPLSAVLKAANLSDDWKQSFQIATAPLNEQITNLKARVGDLLQFEQAETRLKEEQEQLSVRQRELQRLKDLRDALPQLIAHREELERQTHDLEHSLAPEIAQIETAIKSMRNLLERVARDVETCIADEVQEFFTQRTDWLQMYRQSELERNEQAAELEKIQGQNAELVSKNKELGESIEKETAIFNGVTEEQAALLSDLNTHVELNRELNDALRLHGLGEGVEGLNTTIQQLGRKLEELDSGLQSVLHTRQELLSRSGQGS